jgi:hypothetical protein
MTEINIEECINELIAYENFIQHTKQCRQAKALELAQRISVIMEPDDTFFYKNRRKIYKTIKQYGGNPLSRKTKKYIYTAISHIHASKTTPISLHSLLTNELGGYIPLFADDDLFIGNIPPDSPIHPQQTP